MTSITPKPRFIVAALFAALIQTNAGNEPQPDPSTTLWYAQPAASWEREALPIGNGRLGAMIFGGVGHERIALNEESVWSGSRKNWNRENAAANLPKIRELLLAGKNDEAEALVNQTFTCTDGGSKGGSRGPWGCFQELGNLRLVWASDVASVPLNDWRIQMIETPGITDARKQQEAARLATEAVRVEADDSKWQEYSVSSGKVLKGGHVFQNGDRAVLRHHLDLTQQQLDSLGMLRISSEARNGSVYINGEKAGELGGWQASGHDKFEADIRPLLKPGKNLIAIHCSSYRNRGQLPVSISLDPREDVENYRRSLDLREAMSNVEYRQNGVTYKREAFSSAPDQVMVFRFTADKGKKISFNAMLDRLASVETRADGSAGLLITGNTASGQQSVEGMKFVARLHAVNKGGKVSTENNILRVHGADEVVLLVAAATNYQGFAGRGTADPLQATADDIRKAKAKSYDQLRAAHIAEYRRFFDRVKLSLGDGKDKASLPTDQRLAALAKGGTDPALDALYFNFGRYLLISSSRPGTMPANLQGIWAEGLQTPWNGDYHLDINVQMNYWPAEVTGLGECHTPLFKLIESLQKPGAETAKAYYNADGWVAHVITNIWGFTAPGEQAAWGATATGSPWLCDHLWEHYDYNRDNDFLKWAYPIMKGVHDKKVMRLFANGGLYLGERRGWAGGLAKRRQSVGF